MGALFFADKLYSRLLVMDRKPENWGFPRTIFLSRIFDTLFDDLSRFHLRAFNVLHHEKSSKMVEIWCYVENPLLLLQHIYIIYYKYPKSHIFWIRDPSLQNRIYAAGCNQNVSKQGIFLCTKFDDGKMIPATSSSKPLVSSKEHKTKLAPLAEFMTSSVRPSMRLCNKGRTSSLVNSNLSTCVIVLHTRLGLTPDDSNNSGRKKIVIICTT